jgi:hypothetical protein
MDIAQRELGIPAVLEPEYLASPWLDELSGMTYLSYFMKPGSPGFHATLRWVNSRLERPVNNFTVRLMYPRPWLLATHDKRKKLLRGWPLWTVKLEKNWKGVLFIFYNIVADWIIKLSAKRQEIRNCH